MVPRKIRSKAVLVDIFACRSFLVSLCALADRFSSHQSSVRTDACGSTPNQALEILIIEEYEE